VATRPKGRCTRGNCQTDPGTHASASGTHTSADTETDPGTDACARADRDTRPRADGGADPGTDACARADTHTGAGPDGNRGSDTSTDRDSNAPAATGGCQPLEHGRVVAQWARAGAHR